MNVKNKEGKVKPDLLEAQKWLSTRLCVWEVDAWQGECGQKQFLFDMIPSSFQQNTMKYKHGAVNPKGNP